MEVARQVRENYERRPYPSIENCPARRPRWRLPPIEWINAVWQPTRASPARILIAGCGTGNEAFAFRDRFPESEIVAFDFSPRSIALAQNSQRRLPRKRTIHFLVADMAGSKFKKMAFGEFDFVSCHGVVSYVPEKEKALANISRCLAPDGALYLG